MAAFQYTPGNYQYGTHVNITGQFNNLSSSGTFKLPEDPSVFTSQVLTSIASVQSLSFTADQTLTLQPGFVSIKNTNISGAPALDIQVGVNTVIFNITPGVTIFLMVFNGGAQQII